MKAERVTNCGNLAEFVNKIEKGNDERLLYFPNYEGREIKDGYLVDLTESVGDGGSFTSHNVDDTDNIKEWLSGAIATMEEIVSNEFTYGLIADHTEFVTHVRPVMLRHDVSLQQAVALQIDLGGGELCSVESAFIASCPTPQTSGTDSQNRMYRDLKVRAIMEVI